MIEPILRTLDMIASNFDGSYGRQARSDAQGVFWTMKSFQFPLHMIIVRNIISYTLPLTYELQKKRLDVVKAYQAVDNVVEALEDCRENIDVKHQEWYEEVVCFAKEKLDVQPSVKRITGQQTLRENYKTDNPSTFYKVSVTIPFLDMIITELKSRFSTHHRIHSNGYFILPAVVLQDPAWKTNIKQFASEYMSDLPQPLNLETELHQWFVYWKQESRHNRVPDTVSATLLAINSKKNWFQIYTRS